VQRSLRQDSNPHSGRTKGVCSPLTLRRPEETAPRSGFLSRKEWRRRGSNPLLLGANEAFFQKNLIPRKVRTGGVEPPQPEATRLQRGELADAQRPHEWRGWDSNPRSRAHEARGDSRSPTARRALRAEQIWPAGVEPAVSGSRNRRDGLLPYSQVKSTTVESNHACPPHQSGAGPAGPSSSSSRRRQGIAPCSTGSQPAGSLLALRRSLAGRSRTSVVQSRSLVLIR
jgi:hypothetical protein